MTNANESAYGYGFTTADGSSHINNSGLTKREYFAAMAMQGYISGNEITERRTSKDMAIYSVKLADALITALNKTV